MKSDEDSVKSSQYNVFDYRLQIVNLARTTLRNPAVKSLLVETNRNLEDHLAMVGEIEALGFRHDPAQVSRAERKSGTFKGVAEYVFKR